MQILVAAGVLIRTYIYWLDQMRTTLSEGETGWKNKEIEYVKSRDQWVSDVREGKMKAIQSDTKKMRDELAEFSVALNGKTKNLTTSKEQVLKDYTPIVPIPDWMLNYEILAETTFGAMKKAMFSDALIEKSIDSLESTVQEFEDKKMMLELDKLYHDLEVAKDQVMGKIEGIGDGNQDMVETMMFEDGYSVRGGAYYKKALYKYSLLEGERFREIYLPYFKEYAVENEFSSVFNLPDRETFLAGNDIDEKKIEVYRQIASMKSAAKTILGTKNKPGTLYTTNLGRMATGEEIQKYSEQRKKSEPKGWLESFIGALLSPLNWVMQGLTEVLKAVGSLFIPEDGEDPNAGLEQFQKALIRDIPDGKNRGLETGRIMLNYQYNDMLETQAIAARDGGFLNAPLFDGGPSLASVGNIALSIATAGAGTALSALANVGINMAYTLGTGLINYATASNDMRAQVADGVWKSLATQAVSFGIQQGMGELKGLFSFAENGSQNFLAGVTNTLIDTSTELLTSVAGNAINSFDGNGFNQDRFNKGMNNVLLGSIGSLAKNTFKSINMLSTGAHWNKGLTYGIGKYTDEFAGKMMSDTNFFGGLIEQAVNNITGVQQGFTFNILNTKDFGAKNGVGLLELTLGGDSASLRLGTGGLNVSYSGITDMLNAGGQRDALKSAKDELQTAQEQYYDAVESGDQTKIARAKLKLEQADTHMTVYMQSNMAYGQITALEEKIAQETDPDKKKDYQDQLIEAKKQYENLNQALISGNYSSIVQFKSQNQKVGSVAELDSDQIVDFSYDKDGSIVFDMNKMAVSATKLFHELGGHDGKDSGNHENEVAEDKRAHSFDTMLWDGLKQKYGVKDFEMDAKLLYLKLGNDKFNQFLSTNFILGQEKNLSNYRTRDVYTTMRIDLEQYKTNNGLKGTDDQFKAYAQLFNDARSGYVGLLQSQDKMDEYGIGDFNQDIGVMFDVHLNMTVADYNTLVANQVRDLAVNTDLNGRLTPDYVKEQIGESFNRIYTTMYQEGKTGIDKFNMMNDVWSKSFNDNRGYTAGQYDKKSSTWFFELYRTQHYPLDENGNPVMNPGTRPERNNEYSTFFEYYMQQDVTQMKAITNLLKGKEINVVTQTNSTQTHFIANMRVLYNTLNDINNATKGKGGWSGFDWIDGYRYGNSSSPHSYYQSIDMLNLRKSDGTEYNTLENYDILKDLRETGHYGFMEMKANGFHIGENWQYANSKDCLVAWGNTPEDTLRIAKNNLKAMFEILGHDSETESALLDLFYAAGISDIGGRWVYVNFESIDAFIQNNL